MKKPMTCLLIITLLIMAAVAVAGSNKIKIENAKGLIIISNDQAGNWKFAQNGNSWSLENTDGSIMFKKGEEIVAKGRIEGEKLSMRTNSEKTYMRLKIRSDKIKVNWDQTANEWEFKIKPDNIKIRLDGVEFGKIKYYKENNKLKVKDKKDTVGEARNVGYLSAAPGALVIEDLPPDKRAFLMLFLLSCGK